MRGADDMRRALEAERDAALEEVARLAAERDKARAWLATSEAERQRSIERGAALSAQAMDLQRRLDLRESALSGAGADLHALTEEARELGTDAHPDDLRAFVGRLVDVYAGAAGRAVVGERDALRAEAAQLRATAGALTPGRIRAAVLAAIDAVHVAPPTWGESVADDVLARLQASKASAPQPDPLPAEGLVTEQAVAAIRALLAAVSPLGWTPGPMRAEGFYPRRIGSVDGSGIYWSYQTGPFDHREQRWLPPTADLLAYNGSGCWARLQSVAGPDVRHALVLVDGKPILLEEP